MFGYAGWPGPFNRRGGTGGVRLPAHPGHPGYPAHPGSPAHPGEQAAGGEHPLAGLAAHGVPLGLTASGNPVLRAPNQNEGFMMPPQIPGMPQMPGPPSGLLTGGPETSGLFYPTAPVAPFDSANQVRKFQQWEAQAKGEGGS
jgi:hypothetical protein